MGTAIMGVPSGERNHTPEDAVSRGEDEFEVNLPSQRSHHWQLHRVGHLAEVVLEGFKHVEHNVGLAVLYVAHVLNAHRTLSRREVWYDRGWKIFLYIRKGWLGSNILELWGARRCLDFHKVIYARNFSSNIDKIFKVESPVGVEVDGVEEGAWGGVRVVGTISAAGQGTNILVLATIACFSNWTVEYAVTDLEHVHSDQMHVFNCSQKSYPVLGDASGPVSAEETFLPDVVHLVVGC